MTDQPAIPVFTLYGETAGFPDVVHCERFSARAPIHGWRIAAHRHQHMAQIFLIEDGQVLARVDGDDLELSGADYLYIPAQTPHEFVFRPDTQGLVVSVPLDVARTIGPRPDEVLRPLASVLHGVASQRLTALLALLEETTAQPLPMRDQQAVALVHAALAELAAQAAGHGTGGAERLQALDRLIQDHMSKGWSARDYAGALAISTGHLSRLCREATGLGASAYIDQAIMVEASRLLAFTRMPVSDIGFRLGYSDPSHFAKRFKRVRGESPSQYRARFSG